MGLRCGSVSSLGDSSYQTVGLIDRFSQRQSANQSINWFGSFSSILLCSVVGICLRYEDNQADQTSAKDRRKESKR